VIGSIERKVLPMAIEATKKVSDLEKRLRLIRQQVHGKQEYKIQSQSSTPTHTPLSDIVYLKQDILKIGIFSTIAIGVQVILFFLTRNHILNLKLF
jgi:hypothetical protein